MIDGSEKRNRQLAFKLQNSHVCEKSSNNGKYTTGCKLTFVVFSNVILNLILVQCFSAKVNM